MQNFSEYTKSPQRQEIRRVARIRDNHPKFYKIRPAPSFLHFSAIFTPSKTAIDSGRADNDKPYNWMPRSLKID